MKKKFKVKKRNKLFLNLVEHLLFGREVRQLVEVINTDLTASDDTANIRPVTHPAGFLSLITGKWLSIAEAYIHLLACSSCPGYAERIEALQTLLHYIRFSEKKDMSVDIARVQIALLKKAVKLRNNRQAQLELMSDFSQASSGQGRTIKRLLRKLSLIEYSESNGKLYEQILTWDDHVHDSLTNEYHSHTLLVLNAFIKGISKITVSFYDLSDRQQIEETLLASSLLGIHSQIAIRFSVGKAGNRRNYMFIPANTWEIDTFSKFWDDSHEKLKPFLDALKENSRRRSAMLKRLIQTFNQRVIPKFNEPYKDIETLQLAPLSWDDVERVTRHGQVNRKHLGFVLFKAMRPIALKRALYLKNEYRMLDPDSAQADAYFQKYEEAQKIYDELTPSFCVENYIPPESEIDYDSVFENESDILPILAECSAYTAYIRLLRRGIPDAVSHILDNYKYLNDVEVYNMVDAERFGEEKYAQFALFIRALIDGDSARLQSLMHEFNVPERPKDELDAACSHIKAHPFYTRCASDSLGWSSKIPGMGFFHAFQLDTKAFSFIRKNEHTALAAPIANLLSAHRPPNVDKIGVYILSSHKSKSEWLDGGCTLAGNMTPAKLWHYMNPAVRSPVKVIIGLIPICITIGFVQEYQALGLWIAVIWFGVTALRNSIVDMISSSGIGPKNWKLQSVDWENLSTSLFFTGFSVPILSLAKFAFDKLWIDTLAWDTGFIFTFTKFWIIALTNGLYLATHNTIRGFAKPAVRGNFFRSVLSWPLAAAMSYILTPLGIPDVVQAKLASEVVAGLIEGIVKFRRQKANARRALYEVYQQLQSSDSVQALLAKLDILYFWTFTLTRKELCRFFKYPHKIHELDSAQIQTITSGNLLIKDFFTKNDALRQMTCSVLKFYPVEKLEVLTDIAGDNYRPFIQWLHEIDKS